jgi:hypothetical protein
MSPSSEKEGKWSTLITFQGSTDKTTELFYVPSDRWRINWAYIGREYSYLSLQVYSEGEKYPIESVIATGPSKSDTTYIYEGPGNYYVKIRAVVDQFKLIIDAFKKAEKLTDHTLERRETSRKGVRTQRNIIVRELENKRANVMSTLFYARSRFALPSSSKTQHVIGTDMHALFSPKSLIKQYRVSRDLSQLPRMRIRPPRKIQRLKKTKLDVEEIIEWTEREEPSIRKIYPRRRYIWWTIEDRKIFSLYEMRQEIKGYCEECSNYGTLLYVQGLYLCENCRVSLRVSRIPFF